MYMKKPIYIVLIFFVSITLFLLPFIKLPISSSSRGVVRSVQENIQLTAVVSGRVIETKLEKNNQNIKKGETLLIVTAEQLDTQKNLQTNQSADYQAQLSDLQKVSSGNFTGLQTGQYSKKYLLCKKR